MKGEKAMEIFQLVKKGNLLPEKIEKLVPLSFIGQTAVSFYRQKIKLMDQLKMTEEQRKVTLSDGQDAGEMLLDIETRIGELLPSAEEAMKTGRKEGSKIRDGKLKTSSARPPEISPHRAKNSRAISRNPAIVEKVKAEARANEDIPTKTAVLAEIRYEKEKKRREEAEKKKKDLKIVVSIDQRLYDDALDTCLLALPQKPPKKWDEDMFKQVKAKAKILIKRLEVFIDE